VNNLHIITLYKLHNKWSCESRHAVSSCRTYVEPVELVVSSVSSRAVRQARHSQNAWARQLRTLFPSDRMWLASAACGHTRQCISSLFNSLKRQYQFM